MFGMARVFESYHGMSDVPSRICVFYDLAEEASRVRIPRQHRQRRRLDRRCLIVGVQIKEVQTWSSSRFGSDAQVGMSHDNPQPTSPRMAVTWNGTLRHLMLVRSILRFIASTKEQPGSDGPDPCR